MPAFVSAPPSITPRRGITAGLPSYSFGSFPLGVQPARLAVTSVACTSNVITLGVKLLEGNIPTTANNITVTGTVAGGSAVNVTNTALTGVTITPSTGVGTITYALTLANLATTPDGGQVFVLATDIGETTAVAKGLQFALAPDGGYGLTLAWACTAATVALQLEGSVDDVDAQYAIRHFANHAHRLGCGAGSEQRAFRACEYNCVYGRPGYALGEDLSIDECGELMHGLFARAGSARVFLSRFR